jgi:hypothetical protein
MKTRVLILMLVLISILVVPNLFAEGSKKEELYGTWINEEYKGSTSPFDIMVISHKGTIHFYTTEASVWETEIERLENGWIPCDFHTLTIEDKWIDSEGNVWYKIVADGGGYEKRVVKSYLLMKISDSNKVLEYMVGRKGYREVLDPTEVKYVYRIYYRQE